jgi:hypothetical protein
VTVYQFKYYILAYFLYASEEQPNLCRDLLNDANFIQALREIDARYSTLAETIRRMYEDAEFYPGGDSGPYENELRKGKYLAIEREALGQ